jgi:hypothetical protein
MLHSQFKRNFLKHIKQKGKQIRFSLQFFPGAKFLIRRAGHVRNYLPFFLRESHRLESTIVRTNHEKNGAE